MAAIVVVEVEAVAYGMLSLVETRARRYVRVTDADLLASFEAQNRKPSFGQSWDPLLGWDNPSNTTRRSKQEGGDRNVSFDSEGARSNPPFAGQAPFIATYGDSFTAGNEVGDEETWQAYLSQRLGRYVANFGVSSYGTDQALLKYKVKHAARPAAPVVILAIWESNLYRQFYRYRPFGTHGTEGILAFKPMFTLADGELRLIDNPAEEPPTDRARFTAALEEAKSGDLWYSSRIAIGFPFTPNLVRLATILVAHEFDLDLWDLGILPEDLWRSREAVGLMRAIIEDFLATATARDARAIVLFIPGARTLENHHRARPGYETMLEDLRRDHDSDAMLFVDVFESAAGIDRARFNVRPFDGHASAYGNRIIAERLAAAMEERWGRDWVLTPSPRSGL